MQNIYLIPIDTPSYIENLDCEIFDIYIINEEDPYPYALHLEKMEVLKIDAIGEESKELFHKKGFSFRNECKKIILTTNPELIKNGVQSINSEFIDWIINNPSCKFVEVENQNVIDYSFPRKIYNKYKLIIPKEESKQGVLKDKIYQAIELATDKDGIIGLRVLNKN